MKQTLSKFILQPMRNIFPIFIFFSLSFYPAFSQGYLHADGKYIYNGQNEEVILKSIGTGNWMIQEGYI